MLNIRFNSAIFSTLSFIALLIVSSSLSETTIKSRFVPHATKLLSNIFASKEGLDIKPKNKKITILNKIILPYLTNFELKE